MQSGIKKLTSIKFLFYPVAGTLFYFLYISIAGCTPKHDCVESVIHPTFIGFSDSEIDSFVIKAYKAGGSFQEVVDSFSVIDQFASIYTRSGDTTIVYSNDSDPAQWIRPGFDWQLYIPATNRTVRISKITSSQTEDKGRACYNPVHSCTIDGQEVIPMLEQTDKFYTTGYRVYIRK